MHLAPPSARTDSRPLVHGSVRRRYFVETNRNFSCFLWRSGGNQFCFRSSMFVMETENCWTFEKDEMLIELVKNCPGLYSIQSSHYSDHAYKKKTWNEIEQVIQLPSPKNRWESLRGQYRKYLGKLKKSAQKGFKISKWRYLDQMQFINDHINVEIPQIPFTDEETSVENTWFGDRASLNLATDNAIEDQVTPEANDNNDSEQVTDSVQPSTKTPVTRKRKIGSASIKENTSALMKYLLENQQQERLVHPMDHFFKLMAATVKNLAPPISM